MTDTAVEPKKEKRIRRRKEPAAQPPTKTRRRPMLIAMGVALAVVGGLGTWYFFTSVGNTVTILTTSTDLQRGDHIEAGDLSTIEIAGGQSTSAITANNSNDAIDHIALVDLPAGTVLTSSNVGEGLPVADGKSIVGVALTAAQLPSQPLSAGDSVRLVDTPIAQGDPPSTSPTTFEATVFALKYDEQNAQWIVDLIVDEDKAPDIAARAATQRVALILDAGEVE